MNAEVVRLRGEGRHRQATEKARQALAIREEVLGPKHPLTANSLNNLAGLLASQGDYAAAKPLYQQALAIREEMLGPKHPQTATSLNNLALLLQSQGDYAGAKPLYQRALAIREEVLGPKHPLTALSLNNLALLLWAEGNPDGAIAPLRRGFDIVQHNLELAATAQSERQQLAMTLAFRGDFDAYLSLAPHAGRGAEEAYGAALTAKGLVTDRQHQAHALRRALRERPEIAPLIDELQAKTRRLAAMALGTPDPKASRTGGGRSTS